jgi:hypothetical protein
MMLHFVFRALLSSVLLLFASQSPVQGGDGLNQVPDSALDERQFNPVSALTSIAYEKREGDHDHPYQPLSALASAFGRKDDDYGPLSGFTSHLTSQSSSASRQIFRKHTHAPRIATTLLPQKGPNETFLYSHAKLKFSSIHYERSAYSNKDRN